MNKLKTNIIIDILMLVAMAIVSGSGYLIEEVCRRGVTFLGMGRRVWVDIHIWSGIILVALLIVHGFFTKHIPNRAVRYGVYALLLALILIASIPWLFFI